MNNRESEMDGDIDRMERQVAEHLRRIVAYCHGPASRHPKSVTRSLIQRAYAGVCCTAALAASASGSFGAVVGSSAAILHRKSLTDGRSVPEGHRDQSPWLLFDDGINLG